MNEIDETNFRLNEKNEVENYFNQEINQGHFAVKN